MFVVDDDDDYNVVDDDNDDADDGDDEVDYDVVYFVVFDFTISVSFLAT